MDNRRLHGPVRSLVSSFQVAFSGIRHCIRNERNMRIHLTIAAGVLLLSLFYPFTAVHYAVLTMLFAMVIAAEMMNTAVERVVDLESPNYHRLAKIAKDIAAGAVLVCAVAAIFVGLLFFCSGAGIRNVFRFASAHTLVFLAGGAAYLALAFSFIFLPDFRR